MIEELSVHTKVLELTEPIPRSCCSPTQGASPLDYSNWRRRVESQPRKQPAWTGRNFHDLRRTNATAMIAKGVDVKTAQARQERSDPRLTVAYAQGTTEGDRSAASKLGARLMGSASGKDESASSTETSP